MKKAILLLRASKKISGSSVSLSRILFLCVTCLFFIIALVSILLITLSPWNELRTIESTYYITWFILVTTGYGNAMCVYSAFTKIKKEKSKNNFRDFSNQLPVTHHDYMKAQYFDILLCILPGIFVTVLTITLATLTHRLENLRIGLGIVIVYTVILLLLQCVNMSLSTFMHITSNIKEGIFAMLAILPIVAGVWLKKGIISLYSISLMDKQTYTFADKLLNGLKLLGGNIGIIVLILSLVLGYYLCCVAPFHYYKLQGGRS